MKIDVQIGDVQIRHVQAFEHSRGVYGIEITAPFDRNVAVSFGTEADAKGRRVLIDLYALMKDHPSRIIVTLENPREQAAFSGWMFDYRNAGVFHVLAFPQSVFDARGGLVAFWELPSAMVDYLERQF